MEEIKGSLQISTVRRDDERLGHARPLENIEKCVANQCVYGSWKEESRELMQNNDLWATNARECGQETQDRENSEWEYGRDKKIIA